MLLELRLKLLRAFLLRASPCVHAVGSGRAESRLRRFRLGLLFEVREAALQMRTISGCSGLRRSSQPAERLLAPPRAAARGCRRFGSSAAAAVGPQRRLRRELQSAMLPLDDQARSRSRAIDSVSA